MEYKELQRLTYKTLGKMAATGLVGLVLTFGAIKIIEDPNNKATAGAAGLFLSGGGAYLQILRTRKNYFN